MEAITEGDRGDGVRVRESELRSATRRPLPWFEMRELREVVFVGLGTGELRTESLLRTVGVVAVGVRVVEVGVRGVRVVSLCSSPPRPSRAELKTDRAVEDMDWRDDEGVGVC